ncbi:hypothetical protein GCM10023215_64560 [Pseudonocardia yuanmonensis]|uniref:Uncharacterized protein n=1 Tax=Pseudonocardia yuanmonensis TaxID=1095914 RepID=A0ABP8XSX8_9PSEU
MSVVRATMRCPSEGSCAGARPGELAEEMAAKDPRVRVLSGIRSPRRAAARVTPGRA